MNDQLDIEIDLDRKKRARESEAKEKKISTTAPESGWFHKGEQ